MIDVSPMHLSAHRKSSLHILPLHAWLNKHHITVIISDTVYPVSSLFPEEQKQITGVCKKRATEFTAGRNCARQALRIAGGGSPAIPSDSKRRPIWPPGFTGSISHTDSLYCAAVAPQTTIPALGTDIEFLQKNISIRTLQRFCTQEEWQWVTQSNEPLVPALTIFSIKESIYKALQQYTNVFIGFHDISLIHKKNTSLNTVYFIKHLPIANDRIECRHVIDNDYIFSCCVITADT